MLCWECRASPRVPGKKPPGYCCACVSLDVEHLLGDRGLIPQYRAFQQTKAAIHLMLVL